MTKAGEAIRILSVVLVLGVVLSACRAEEQGRLMEHKPGVYLGQPDEQVSDAAVKDARFRAKLQAGSVLSSSGAFGRSTGVNPVRTDDQSYQELRERARQQAGSVGN